MLQIDELTNLFPAAIQKDWYKVYNRLSQNYQIHPYGSFMEFLESERDIVIRIAEKQPRRVEPTRHVTSSRSMHFETTTTSHVKYRVVPRSRQLIDRSLRNVLSTFNLLTIVQQTVLNLRNKI